LVEQRARTHGEDQTLVFSIPGATKNGSASGMYKMTAPAHGPSGLLYGVSEGDATVWVLRP
jgi:hypothetical protein